MDKIKVIIKGTEKDGYSLTMYNPVDEFKWDTLLTHKELLAIKEEINKKIK